MSGNYWDKYEELEDQSFELFYDENLPVNLLANIARSRRRVARYSLVEVYLQTADLSPFQCKNGRLNIRKLARHFLELLAKRDEEILDPKHIRTGECSGRIGLRTMEITLREIIAAESENSDF